MEHPELILLVDDEEGILRMLKMALGKERYHNVLCATSGGECLEKIGSHRIDLILLDVMLPDCSGFDLCLEIRKSTNAPIIFVTACDSDLDKITGLTIGGDDYITKPFHPIEVVARMRAIFRRQKLVAADAMAPVREPAGYEYSAFSLYPGEARLVVAGQAVQCTAKELELLAFFCRHPNQIFSTTQIYRSVWDAQGYGDEKTVAVYIARLRKKIGDCTRKPQIIVNMRGLGYKFQPPAGREWA